MMRRLALILVLLLWSSLPLPAFAEKRVALLIGNQSYTNEIGRLANPLNDIAMLEKALKGLGFDVTTVRDAGLAALHQAINAYARRVRSAGPDAISFFYYSGHGAADAGTNYLIPVDVRSAEEGDLWDQALRLTEITRKLKGEAGNATHFVVFDACRNNLKLRKAGTRALVQSKGFVPVAQESGMLIAYATAEGELASDVGADAGPYAKMLADEIIKPGVEAVTMFRNVQVRVRGAIGQEPWIGFSALGVVHLAGVAADAPKPSPVAPTPAPPTRQSDVSEAWSATKDTTSVAALEAFIRRFGNTYYGDLAKVRLAEIKDAEKAARTAEQERRKKIEDENRATEAARKRAEEQERRKKIEDENRATEAARNRAEEQERRKKIEDENRAAEAARKRAEEQERATQQRRRETASVSTPRPRSTEEIASNWGLIGTWALDCNAAPSNANGYLRYLIKQGGGVSHQRDFGDRNDSNEVLSAVSRNGQLELTVHFSSISQTRKFTLARVADGRVRAIANSLADGSQPTIVNGKFTANGAATPVQTRCY